MVSEEDLAVRVAEVLETNTESFRERAEADGETVKEELAAGTFDNPISTIGLEYEFFTVDRDSAELCRTPRRALQVVGFEKELGLHNLELNTTPQPMSARGLLAQEHEIRAKLEAVERVVQPEDVTVVSDGIWTVPPAGQSATEYLAASVDREVRQDGHDRTIRIASNMSDSARYHAMANTEQAGAARMAIDAPHVTVDADTVMPESLISSIQPHYQIPNADDLPTYFNYAVRIAGPLLALAGNSPLFPADCYADAATTDEIIDDGWDEHRILVFESVLNDTTGSITKVRFPSDLERTEEAVDNIVADASFVPMPVSTDGDRFDDEFAHFRMKHGTYWRWVRPVFEGASRQGANVRVEFRPIPSQPTVRDTMAFQAAFAGLMESLPRLEHPAIQLDWEDARTNFYEAAEHGLDGDLFWLTNDGEPTKRIDRMLSEVLDYAADGLSTRGLDQNAISRYLYPLRWRLRRRLTPADWKRRQVKEAIADGASLEDAVAATHREYIELQRATLLDGSFADWSD